MLSPGDIIYQLPNFMRIAGNVNVLIRNCKLIEIGGLTLISLHDTTRCGEFIFACHLKEPNVSATASYYHNSGGSGTACARRQIMIQPDTFMFLMLQIPCV